MVCCGVGASMTPFLASFMTGLPAWPLLVSVAAVGVTLAGIRTAWTPYSRRLHRTLAEVVAEVVAHVDTPALGAGDEEGLLPPVGDDASPGV